MFKQSAAKLSLLLLAFFLLPSGMLHADTLDSTDIVVGPDPAPTGGPHPNAIGGWFELELGIMLALQMS